jgi:DNA repair/transcription protein MET18/MMS19
MYKKCDVFAASVTRFTISQVVPHLVKLFMSPDEVLTRPATMQLLSDLIIAARDPSGQDLGSEQSPALTPYKDDVFTITIVALGNISSRQAALASLDGLVTTRGLLSDDELGIIVNNINDLLQAETDESYDTR